jgi:hypothetical protein
MKDPINISKNKGDTQSASNIISKFTLEQPGSLG